MKAMTRLIPIKHGAVYLDGQSIHQMRTRDVARKLAILPQNALCPDSLTVEELVANGRFPYRKGMKGLTKEDYRMIRWAMDACNISDFSLRRVDSLSGGQRQRVWIAMALAQKTDILFLDEPTTFLDIAHQLDIMHLLVSLNKEQGVTIVMVLHDLNHAAMFSHNIVAISNGTKYCEGSPDQVIVPEVLRAVFNVEAVTLSHPALQASICLPYGLCKNNCEEMKIQSIHKAGKI